MKFSVVTHAVGHSLSFEETLATIKEIGFEGVLLLTSRDSEPVRPDGTCPKPFPDVLHSEPEHVLKAMSNAGLRIAAIHYSGKIDVESDEGADKSVADIKEYADFAVALGCGAMTLPVPSCSRTHVPTEEKAPQIRRYGSIMNRVAEAYTDHGLKLACDVHYRAYIEGLDDCRLLVQSMPCANACLGMNIGHFTTAQAYGWLLVDDYPDRIPLVGWKDHSLAPDRPRPMWSIELGTGHSPFELYIRRFKRHPAERQHLINCEDVVDAERVPVLRRSLAYLSRLWETVE
ncbi:MAG: sugar phosphate isomerase/epimerase [Armatimonadetes bacterium]|nr:sugar phosphate isomerase/epimerase [Armatimonadota bacterium]